MRPWLIRADTRNTKQRLMRTKTLLLSAAVGAAGMLAASAQVYSVNSVGYINVPISVGYNLISNPLVPSGGALTLNSVLPNAAEDEVVFTWNPQTQGYNNSIYVDGIGWAPNLTLAPGEGFFYQAFSAGTVTFVGEVRQTGGGLQDKPIVVGFNLVSSQVPQAATLDALGVPGNEDDVVFRWNAAAQSYQVGGTYVPGLGWAGGTTVGVAEAFFVQASAPLTWSRSFNVNQ